ncbi:MAG: hypothetical protein LBK06_04910, partial [Planctomycetaceae bacterium]|nr:hypothetical protein [Planctomycetaceae bacterium]
ALEQSLHVVALPCSALRILKRLQHTTEKKNTKGHETKISRPFVFSKIVKIYSQNSQYYTVAGKAIGFALEQPLHVVALPCSALQILKRLQHIIHRLLGFVLRLLGCRLLLGSLVLRLECFVPLL